MSTPELKSVSLLKFRGSWTLRVLEAISFAGACLAFYFAEMSAGVRISLSESFTWVSFNFIFVVLALHLAKNICSHTGSVLGVCSFVAGMCAFAFMYTSTGHWEYFASFLLVSSFLIFVRECGIEIEVSPSRIVKRQRFLFPSETTIQDFEIENLSVEGRGGGSSLKIVGRGKEITIATPRFKQLNVEPRKILGDLELVIGFFLNMDLEDGRWLGTVVEKFEKPMFDSLERQLKTSGVLYLGRFNIIGDRVIVKQRFGKTVL